MYLFLVKICIITIGEIMKDLLLNCELCPKKCHINRHKTPGSCHVKDKIIIARAALYYYEEPCISGVNGSGAIFFSNCNLNCLYCQNYYISHQGFGKVISITRLSEIFLELQNEKAHNINLISSTPYLPMIIKAIKKAKKQGLVIPIVYNTSGYENKEIIKLLDGYIDVYLPDFKYYDNIYGQKYSNINNYASYAKEAIDEMVRQTGPCVFDKNQMLVKGTIVRHLMLPTLLEDSKKIITYLYKTYHHKIYISLMNQYTPVRKTKYKELNTTLSKQDYEDIINYAINLGIKNCYCQLDETVSESFIPDFDLKGVKKRKN